MYLSDAQDRARQQEEFERLGTMNKMGVIGQPLPFVPYSSQPKPTYRKPPSVWDRMQDTAIKQGVQGVGDALGGKQVAGTAAAGYDLYKALQQDSTKGKVLGSAGAINRGLQANDVYGPGWGSGIGAGIGAANILSSDGTDKQKATALRRTGEDAAANYFTAGLWGLAQTADRALLGGQTDKLRAKAENVPVLNMPLKIGDKITAKALGLFGSGKGEDQQKRDQVRKMLQGAGFFGGGKDDWTLDNPDGTGFDVGKDGGARLDDGRRYDEVNTETQGKAIGAVDPLAYLITGGDQKLATSFAGYFTNTITQGNGASDPAIANANALDKYKKAGYDTPEKAHQGIDDLVKAGKLDPAKAAAFHGGINTVFGRNPTTPKITAQMGGTQNHTGKGGKRRGGGGRRTYQTQTYTPTTYAPTTTAPMGTSSPYGDSFAQSLANIYSANQGL